MACPNPLRHGSHGACDAHARADGPVGRRRAAGRGEHGFSLVEVLVAAALLLVAVLGHAATVMGSHGMSRSTAEHGTATDVLGRFIERLRADPDWATLYARLRTLSSESASDPTLTRLDLDPSLPTHAASVYYSDFAVPSSLGNVSFLVQVPSSQVAGVAALRESAVAPRYGLPHDLNADGLVDANSRNSDYLVLPVVVRVRWQRAGQNAQEVVLATLLRCER